jgi:hypothetical protein
VQIGVGGIDLPSDDVGDLLAALERVSTLRRQRTQSIDKDEDTEQGHGQEGEETLSVSQKKRKHKRSRK